MNSLATTSFPTRPLCNNQVSISRDEGIVESESVSDELLISRICENDTNALGVLFRRHARLIYGIGRRILRDATEADDFVQDFFLHISRKSHLYDPSKSPARNWIVQTAYYEVLHRRTRLSRLEYRPKPLSDVEEAKITLNEAREYDRSGEGLFGRTCWPQLLECLTEDQRETFRLHFYEGYTFGEIAEKRNLSVSSVRHHFYRGLDRLRKRLFTDRLQHR